MIAMVQGWCSRSVRGTIVIPRAPYTVELTLTHIGMVPRQPVDRARAVENAKSAFPTSSLHAHRTRAHTLHRHHPWPLDEEHKERKMARYNPRRITRPTAVVASLR